MKRKDHDFLYLATPYSKYPGGIQQAAYLACAQRAILIKASIPCFSPIAHSHWVALLGNLDPLDHSIWLPSEAPIMAAAHGLIVVMATSWKDSRGISEEIKIFTTTNRPIIYMIPGIVPELKSE